MRVRGAYPGDYSLLPYAKDKWQSMGPEAILWLIESKFIMKVQVAPIVHPESTKWHCIPAFAIGNPAICLLVRLEPFMLLFCKYFFA